MFILGSYTLHLFINLFILWKNIIEGRIYEFGDYFI